ncbi:MAG: beta-eliminating lyase-related protein [Clostridiales bacterium]|nr:beta-eliminating lyase-related protein [Clostridiales bacterium]
MIGFRNDYGQGAHPDVLRALCDTNLVRSKGYGIDAFCDDAADKIRLEFACPNAAVHFLPGGTLTNLTALSAFLRPYEAVITAHSGHIAVHEAGAIEATGHRLLSLPSSDGKITPTDIAVACAEHGDEHMVIPRLVYISNSTELGTVYSLAELTALRACCDAHHLYLYMDGARLAHALTSEANDVSPAQIASLTDAFYIGGTKNGAMFGEALFITNAALMPHFRHAMKQRGAMLAKSHLMGVQFATLFTDKLYFRLGSYANALAARLQSELLSMGIEFQTLSPTNLIFPILDNAVVAALAKNYDFEIWCPMGNRTMIRLVTGWASTDAEVDKLVADLRRML